MGDGAGMVGEQASNQQVRQKHWPIPRVGTPAILRSSYVFRCMGGAARGGPHQRPVATWKARVRHTQFTECHKGSLSERM